MPKRSDQIKATIVSRPIEADQRAVAEQWSRTFLHNDQQDVATRMAKCLLACVAVGDFKVRSLLLKDKGLSNPGQILSAVDYLSHASRISIDYSRLSADNQQALLKFFDGPQIVSRSATHAISRQGEGIVEEKGFLLGVAGQLPSHLKTPRDFGINIAMGGAGRLNFVGKHIAANGFSGHLYYHHNELDRLLLVGLEQSAPATSFVDLIKGEDKDAGAQATIQSGTDQFDQGHSFTGASDSYTAAGSLYFSDPLYQAKCLVERKTAPPDKYGGMQVILTDQHWEAVIEYIQALDEIADEDEMVKRLLIPPSTASQDVAQVESFIALDFTLYLKRLSVYLVDLDQTSQQNILNRQIELLSVIKQLQVGMSSAYKAFLNHFDALKALDDAPENYKVGIDRLKSLFDLQLNVDKELNETHQELLARQLFEKLILQCREAIEQAQAQVIFFSSPVISSCSEVSSYLGRLEKKLSTLNQIRGGLELLHLKMPTLVDLENFQTAVNTIQTALDTQAPTLDSASMLQAVQEQNHRLHQTVADLESEKSGMERVVEDQQSVLDAVHAAFSADPIYNYLLVNYSDRFANQANLIHYRYQFLTSDYLNKIRIDILSVLDLKCRELSAHNDDGKHQSKIDELNETRSELCKRICEAFINQPSAVDYRHLHREACNYLQQKITDPVSLNDEEASLSAFFWRLLGNLFAIGLTLGFAYNYKGYQRFFFFSALQYELDTRLQSFDQYATHFLIPPAPA